MINKNYIYAIIFALIHFLITTVGHFDSAFFNYSNLNVSNMIYMKILYFYFLTFAYIFIFYVIQKIKEKDPLFIRGLKIFGIYFSIMLVLILLVWPMYYLSFYLIGYVILMYYLLYIFNSKKEIKNA